MHSCLWYAGISFCMIAGNTRYCRKRTERESTRAGALEETTFLMAGEFRARRAGIVSTTAGRGNKGCDVEGFSALYGEILSSMVRY